MPLYEYACKSCGQHLEVAQSFKDEPLTTCPACGGPLRKVFGSIGISFKGSGFYRTDSRTAAKKEKEKEKETAKAESGDKADTKPSGDKSDAKPSGEKSASGGGEKAASGSGETSSSTAKAKTA